MALKLLQHGTTTESKAYPPTIGSGQVDALQQVQMALQNLTTTADDPEHSHARGRLERDRKWVELLAHRDAELQTTRALLETANTQLAAEQERGEAAERKYARELHMRLQADERAEAAEDRIWDNAIKLTTHIRLLDREIEDLKKNGAAARAQAEEMRRRLDLAEAETKYARWEIFSLQQRLGESVWELRDVEVREAWRTYQALWSMFADEPLSFRIIPWPTVRAPWNPEDITLDAVRKFIFSDAHSPDLSKRERVKKALLRWHPDRFQARMRRIPKAERESVRQAVNIVAGCLSDLLQMI